MFVDFNGFFNFKVNTVGSLVVSTLSPWRYAFWSFRVACLTCGTLAVNPYTVHTPLSHMSYMRNTHKIMTSVSHVPHTPLSFDVACHTCGTHANDKAKQPHTKFCLKPCVRAKLKHFFDHCSTLQTTWKKPVIEIY